MDAMSCVRKARNRLKQFVDANMVESKAHESAMEQRGKSAQLQETE